MLQRQYYYIDYGISMSHNRFQSLISYYHSHFKSFIIMIQKKSFGNAIKRALQQGTFNYVGQETKQIPPELFKLQELPLDGQNWWDCVPITKMDFSNNEITVIPQKINIFADLQLLRMKNNMLLSLPVCLASLQTFKLLDVSRNKISSIPKQYALFPALVQLNLSENCLTVLPDFVGIKTLQVLLINDNKIKDLPILGENVKKVEASTNAISRISAQTFRRCNKLQTLALNKNFIQNIEKGAFSQTKNMISLELKENRLTSFSQMPWSQKLDTITLSFNRLSEFNDFDKCPNLTVLTLNDNKIKKISGDIIKLTKLKTLDISNNDLPDLPSQLGFIDSLVRLQLQGNPLKAIRQNIRAGGVNQIKKYLKDRMDPNQRQNLEKKLIPSNDITPHQHWTKILQEFMLNGQLVLRGMKLETLNQTVFQRDIRVLNLTQNKLTEISESIQRLQSLKSLILNHNELSKLPDNLAILPHLDSIEAQHNKLTDFVFFRRPFFVSLLHLDLSTNRLMKIPQSVLKIPKLRTLLLSYNKINSIQIILQNEEALPCLEILDVSNNIIDDISDLIFTRHSLNYLNLQNNNLSRLPTVLGFMKLMGLKVDGNPLKQIKRQIIEKGTVVLMQFLRNKHVGDPPIKPKKQVFRQEKQQPVKYQPPKREVYPQKQQARFYKQQREEPKQNNEQKQALIASIQKQIRAIEQELENGMGLNNWQKTEKKKKMQSLMIQRNKLLKQ